MYKKITFKITVLVLLAATALAPAACGPYGSQAVFLAGMALAADNAIGIASDLLDDDDGGSSKVKKTLVPVDIKIAVVQDADVAWLEDFSDRVTATAAMIYHATRGQMYLRKVVIKDKCSSGQVIVSPLSGPYTDTSPYPGAGSETPVWADPSSGRFGVGGEYLDQAFLQGWGYVRMNRGYDTEYGCAACCMGYPIDESDQVLHYCDGAVNACTVSKPCWDDFILEKYVNWSFPNDGYDTTVPETEVVIVDQ